MNRFSLATLSMLRHLPGAAWRLARRGRLAYAVSFALRTWWRQGLACAVSELTMHLAQGAPYSAWIAKYDTLHEADRQRLQAVLDGLAGQPLISLLMPLYNSPERWLRETIASIRGQIYPHWELCLVDDASTAPHVRPLVESLAGEDPRIRVRYRKQNGHISAASNDALAMARGEFIGLVDHDDLLSAHALALVAIELDRYPDAGLIYSDEDKVDLDGRRFGPYFKPDWNPDLMRSQNMVSHFGVYRTALARQVGGFRIGYEGSQDWDLALRVTEVTGAGGIRHLPYVLYHWRTVPGSTSTSVDAKSYAVDAARRAVSDHLARQGMDATVSHLRHGQLQVHYSLPSSPPAVSLVVSLNTDEDWRALARHLPDWLRRAGMPVAELVLSGDPVPLHAVASTLNWPVPVVAVESGSGVAASRQRGAERATGAVLVFMSPRLMAETDHWLAELVAHAVRQDTGAVGAGLRTADAAMPAGGYILGLIEGDGHRQATLGNPASLQGRAQLQQNLTAVSGDCLVVCRDRYFAAGGFNPADCGDDWADVDLCLRLGQRGLWNVWVPQVVLSGMQKKAHFHDRPRNNAAMLEKWPEWFAADPAFNDNLSLRWNAPIPDEPRQPLPWRVRH